MGEVRLVEIRKDAVYLRTWAGQSYVATEAIKKTVGRLAQGYLDLLERLEHSDNCQVADLEGMAARLTGKGVATCPYPEGDCRSCWELGWQRQDAELQLRADLSATRTRLERVTAEYQVSEPDRAEKQTILMELVSLPLGVETFGELPGVVRQVLERLERVEKEAKENLRLLQTNELYVALSATRTRLERLVQAVERYGDSGVESTHSMERQLFEESERARAWLRGESVVGEKA